MQAKKFRRSGAGKKNHKRYARFGICKRCGRERLIKARGMCDSDYQMWWRMQHRVRCKECPQMVHRHGRYQLCKPCSMLGERNPARMKMRRIYEAYHTG